MSAAYDYKNIPQGGQDSRSPAMELQKYFGPLRNADVEAWAQDQFSHETHNLPKAYEGRNKFLMATIDFLITKDDDWYTRVACPWEFTEELHVQWNIWRFNKTMMDYEPHQGVPRYVTQEGESHSASLSRRGLAFIIEHGFWKTELGKQHYLMNLRQIVDAVHETVYYGVIHALLSCDNHYEQWTKRHGVLDNRSLQTVLQDEKFSWAVVQKDVKGLYVLDAEVRDRMRRQGIEPNAWIFPPKMAIYASMVPDYMTEFNRRGETAKDSLETGPTMFNTLRGLPVYETRTFDVDFMGDGIEPLSSHAQCGEYYQFPALTRTSAITDHIYIFNMDTDRFEKITRAEAFLRATDADTGGARGGVTVADELGIRTEDDKRGTVTPGMEERNAHAHQAVLDICRINKQPVPPDPMAADANDCGVAGRVLSKYAGHFVLMRPHMTYNMSSALCIRGGETLGQTFHGHHDFQLTDDVIHKTHVGHYTFYSKTIVRNPKQLYIARNVFCQGYEYGENIKFVKKAEDLPGMASRVKDTASIISVYVGRETQQLQNPLCMHSRGFAHTMPSVDIDDHNNGKLPAGAGIEIDVDPITNKSRVQGYFDDAGIENDEVSPNHVVWQGCQKIQTAEGKKQVTHVGTGHWGPNVYDGCGSVRRGQYAHLKECSYECE